MGEAASPVEAAFRLRHEGKVAVVTGAAGGLGQAFSVRLAADGASVVAVDRRDPTATAERAREHGPDAIGWQCDLTSESGVQALADAVAARFGRCDILVNNAGISHHGPIEETSLEDWRAVMSINLDAMFLTCRAFVPLMRQGGWGRIVNVSSNTFGLVAPNLSAYIASKGGVIGLTRALASELGPSGIVVNSILPGLTRVERTEGIADQGFVDFAESAANQAIPRTEVPDDLAGAVSFLASHDAQFLTGQAIVVDGGLVRH